ncbi:MAG: zinc ribbon domain-containing protein [Candidatus Heimdallarchaeota archaeon]|nr:zinc ribbon domain-containing protein [Candidatus Heimdallarchaeota archaeon]
MAQCKSCHKEAEDSWKYCRFCGTAIQVKKQEELAINEEEITKEVKEKVVFDKDLYYKVLSSRADRKEIVTRKTKLKLEINSLLEQLESGLIQRDYALPKIKNLKAEVVEVNTKEEKFKDLPEQLPVELLLDQLDAAEKRRKKLNELKNDPAITKEALKEAYKRSDDAIKLLREEHSVISGYLKAWHNEIKIELEEERASLEQLYIRVKTGELTEGSYSEKKEDKIKKISTLNNISEMLEQMI